MRDNDKGGLDRFRIIAALLVTAIHTSPLSSFSPLADFVLTRVIARLAVPFFLMVTGYFALSEYIFDKAGAKRLLTSIKKTTFLYLAASALYLPLGIYAGRYDGANLFSALKTLVFDGTFYHLWYLPAAIIGLGLIYFLGNKLAPRTLLIGSAVLYIVGLFGDSYYGMIENVPVISWLYRFIFYFCGYTRNGIFFAPLFLMLGAYARKTYIAFPAPALALSTAAMTAEALSLRYFGFQRHDSMYIFLPFCSFALFLLLLGLNVRSAKRLRTVSASVYILHPWMIVIVRLTGKLFYARELFVENSLVHYVAVCLLSLTAAWAVTKLMPERADGGRAWAELELGALRHNVEALRSRMPEGCELMPAVKADAYGHGAVTISRELNRLGIRAFCVATAQEGAELRRGGIRGEILILGCTPLSQLGLVRRFRLTQTVPDMDYAERLNGLGKKIKVHIAVDTGMNRLGERPEDAERIIPIFEMKSLSVTGVYTHLCASECAGGAEFTREQGRKFDELTKELRNRGYSFKAHILNSGGLISYPELGGDYARVGIALYGTMSTPEAVEAGNIDLRPVLSLKSKIVLVREIKAGENVGYGLSYTAEGDMKLAVIPVGYADGIPRSLSMGAGKVIVGGEYAPIVGRVCMDQLMADVTGLDVRSGDEVILIGGSGDKRIRVCDMAAAAGTISNEILSRLGKRIPRVTV